MAEVAWSYYTELSPMPEAVRGDRGVALNSELNHWVAYWKLHNSNGFEVHDPYTGCIHYYSPDRLHKEFTFGFSLRDPGRGEFSYTKFAKLASGQFGIGKTIEVIIYVQISLYLITF